MAELRRCNACKVEKPLTEFQRRGDGLDVVCRACRNAATRRQYEIHKENRRESRRKYATESAGSRRAYSKAYYQRNRERLKSYAMLRRVEFRAHEMLRCARERARRRGLPFDLTLDDIVVPERCPLLGVPIHTGIGHSPRSPSLDRIVPEKGYVRENVIVVSHRANSIKHDATPDELETIARNLRVLMRARGLEPLHTES